MKSRARLRGVGSPVRLHSPVGGVERVQKLLCGVRIVQRGAVDKAAHGQLGGRVLRP